MDKQKLLYIYPPDFQKSQKHRLAKRIFKGIQHNPQCSECQCCDRKIGVQNVDINCCYDLKQLAFLGPGVPLFFCYLKNAIILLLVLIIVFIVFSIYSNISSNYCASSATTCEYNIFNTLSILNKINQSDYLSIQNYVLVGFTTSCVLLFQWFRYNFRIVQEECDDIIDSPSDYAIILRRLPPQIEQKDIQNMINQKRQQLTNQQMEATQNLKIDHIVLSFSMSQYKKIKEENIKLFKQKIEEQKEDQFKPVPLPSFKQTASIAIVIFTKQQSKQLLIYKPNIFQKFLQCLCTPCTPLSNFKIKNNLISVQRAPQPDDIIWQNTKISMSGAIFRKTFYNILAILILLLGGAAQYGLAKTQNQISDPLGKQLMSIALSLLVTMFNFLILQFLVFTSQKERNQTLTQYNTVLTVKISFFQFLNTGIFVILGNFLADTANFTLQNGMPFQICLVMMMNAISPNLSLWVLNYFQLTGKLFRWLIQTKKIIATQFQSNLYWQKPAPQIPYKYAYILKTIWLTAFYAPFAPLVVPISLIGLILNYLIQKHFYGHVYSAPNMLSSMVNDSAIQLMQYFPLILSFGEFVIYLYFINYNFSIIPLNWELPIYISLCLSFLNLILPMDSINKCIIKLPIDTMKFPSYQKVQSKFQVTYQMTNPAYICQRKRKRDVFLFNHIFGGQGKNVALQMTNLFGGISENNNSAREMHHPLLNQKQQKNLSNQIQVNPFSNFFAKKKQKKQQGIINLNQKQLSQLDKHQNYDQKANNLLQKCQISNKFAQPLIQKRDFDFKKKQTLGQYKVKNSVKNQSQKLEIKQLQKNQSIQMVQKHKDVAQQKQQSTNIKKSLKMLKQHNSTKPNKQEDFYYQKKNQTKNLIKQQKQKNQNQYFFNQKNQGTTSLKQQSEDLQKVNKAKSKLKQTSKVEFRQNQIYNPRGKNYIQKQTPKFQENKSIQLKNNHQMKGIFKAKEFSSFFK